MLVVVLLGLASLTDGKLLQVQALVRHGNRAPDMGILTSCPRLFPSLSALVDLFGAFPERLTRQGLIACNELGGLLRDHYIVQEQFVPESYHNATELFQFQARGDIRHQQSLAALGDGLFPPGTGPEAYPGRRQPLPYFSWDDWHDTVWHPPVLCLACRKRDDAEWTQTRGVHLMLQNRHKVDAISSMCGYDISGASVPSASLKLIADGFEFLGYEGVALPVQNWANLSTMAIHLSYRMFVQRLFGKEEQVTYWAGDYPRKLVSRMLSMAFEQADGVSATPTPKLFVDTVSRELVFALVFWLGLELDLPLPSTPKGSVPPGSALVFELHQADEDTEQLFVRIFEMWPQKDPEEQGSAKHRKQYKPKNCEFDCPLEAFVEIIRRREEATGTWLDICSRYTTADLYQEYPEQYASLVPPPATLSRSRYASLQLQPLIAVLDTPLASLVADPDTLLTTAIPAPTQAQTLLYPVLFLLFLSLALLACLALRPSLCQREERGKDFTDTASSSSSSSASLSPAPSAPSSLWGCWQRVRGREYLPILSRPSSSSSLSSPSSSVYSSTR